MPEKLLLVEGEFDKYFIRELLRQPSNTIENLAIESFKIANKAAFKADEQGIFSLLKSLPVIIKATPPTSTLGVVVDADMHAAGRWQRIQQILLEEGYQHLPTTTFPNGLIVPTNDILPRFGLWIMPDNQEAGIIENFIRQLIHNEDKLQPEIDLVLDTLRQKDLQLFTDIHRPKAFIRTWLAWQQNPETSFGVAIAKKVLTTEAELGQRFVNWLNQLFNPS